MRAPFLPPFLFLLALVLAALVGAMLLGAEARVGPPVGSGVTRAPPVPVVPGAVVPARVAGATGSSADGSPVRAIRTDATPPTPHAFLVRAEDGAPLAGARAVFRPHVRGCRFPDLEPDPWFAVSAEGGGIPLPRSGSWELRVSAPDRVGARIVFPADDPPERIALRRGVLVQGRVSGAGGVPPARTWIRAQVQPGLADTETIGSAGTDAAGRFVLGPVPERCTLVLVTRGPDGQELRSRPVAVAPGFRGPVPLDWPLPADPR